MTVNIVGRLEVDVARGVLYFHNYTNGCTTLRICGLKDKVEGFSHKSQLDITIPVALVMRSEMLGPVLKQSPGSTRRSERSLALYPNKEPKVFFLNETHTTHISKAKARRERAELRKTLKKVAARADHLLKKVKKGGRK